MRTQKVHSFCLINGASVRRFTAMCNRNQWRRLHRARVTLGKRTAHKKLTELY